MVSRKRGRAEMESPEPAPELGLLDQIRNMWEFANLMQYVFIFGKAVKIDEDLDIEVHDPNTPLIFFSEPRSFSNSLELDADERCLQDLETECLKPGPSEKLSEIGLALLKFVSSHRGLTCVYFYISLAQVLTTFSVLRSSMNTRADSIKLKLQAATPSVQRRLRASLLSLTYSQRFVCYFSSHNGH